jgi:hypothetical protein
MVCSTWQLDCGMPDDPKISDELKRMEHEPLLPAEKMLIVWSLALGIGLLGLLIWISYKFFPG